MQQKVSENVYNLTRRNKVFYVELVQNVGLLVSVVVIHGHRSIRKRDRTWPDCRLWNCRKHVAMIVCHIESTVGTNFEIYFSPKKKSVAKIKGKFGSLSKSFYSGFTHSKL